MKTILIPKVIVVISIGCNMKEEETNNQSTINYIFKRKKVVLSIYIKRQRIEAQKTHACYVIK